MSRPHKEDTSERRTEFAGFQLTPTERAELDRRAASFSLTLSDFLRMVSLSDLKAPPPSPRDAGAVRSLAAQIARQGNSVNQMAHVANAIHALPHLDELRTLADEIKATLAKVRAL
jgi:hypothetical protein